MSIPLPWTDFMLLAQDEAVAAGGLALFFGCYCFAILLGIASYALWIWMLIDCASNEPAEGNDKLTWILILVFLQVLGAFLYYFIRRPKRMAEHGK